MNDPLKELEEWLAQRRDECELLKASLRIDTEEGLKMLLASITIKNTVETILAKIAEMGENKV